ncbi:Tyrosine recombinase XerC [subsurface metagenome]
MASRNGLRPKTKREYENHLALFQRAFPDLPKIPKPIQSWLNSFELAPETVHARFRTIRALYNQLELWHPKIPNPMKLVRPPRMATKAMRTFSEEELYRLFSLPLGARELALLTLLLDTGPRAGECANLTWEDVIPGYAVLRGKTGARIVPISEITYRRLLVLSIGGGSHVFLGKRGPLTYQGIYKLVRHLCHQAGINGKRCSPHTFRHTFGTEYAAAESCDPKVLQDILGHKDFATTLRYIQNNPRRMAKNHQRCTPLKLLAAAAVAQGSLFDKQEILNEAEAILTKKEGK